MKIYFVRHGQTQHNIEGRANSQIMDDFLTEEGIKQAEKTLLEMPDDYDEIYSSDITRAKQTAEILNKKLNLLIKYDERLRERSLGLLSGKLWEEIGLDLKFIDKSQKYDYKSFEGESVEDVKNRLFNFIDDIRRNSKGKKVLAVTHGGIIRLLYNLLNGEVPEKIHNASIHEFEFLDE